MYWRYKEPGRYLGWAKHCFDRTALGLLVRVNYYTTLDQPGFRQEFMKALHRRISAKGGDDRQSRDELRHLRQDQADLERWRQRVNPPCKTFRSYAVRKRFQRELDQWREDRF